MNYNTAGWNFEQVRDEILVATQDRHNFWETTLGEVVMGYDGEVLRGSEQTYVLTENGLKGLCERIDYPIGALKRLSPMLRSGVVAELASENHDVPVKLATSDDNIDAIFSGEYQPIANGTLVVMLDQLLPEDATVHRWNLTNNNRTLDLRVVARESWAVDLGNGRPDPGFGGIHIRNNELGKQALSVELAVARVGCMNYVISSKEVIRQAHRWFDANELAEEMRANMTRVHEYALAEAEEMRRWRDIPVEEPELVFRQIGQDGGIPRYVMDDAVDYWRAEGEKHNQFEVMQAIAHGLKQVNERNTRGNPWTQRNRLEKLVLSLGIENREYYDEHQHTVWEECVACHRPLEAQE